MLKRQIKSYMTGSLKFTHEITNNCTATFNYTVTLETTNKAYAANYYVLIAQFILATHDRHANSYDKVILW